MRFSFLPAILLLLILSSVCHYACLSNRAYVYESMDIPSDEESQCTICHTNALTLKSVAEPDEDDQACDG